MSKLNKRASLLAVAVALALPGTAMAVTAGFPSTVSTTYASNVVNASTTSLTVPAGATFAITPTDNLAGRTVGFGVRITLTGANFGVGGAPTLAVSADQASTAFDGGTVTLENQTGNIALYSIGVNTANTGGMAVGDVLDLSSFVIQNITANQVTATIQIFDPTTNQVLATAAPFVLFSTKEAVVATISTVDGDTQKRIDVVDGSTYPAKTAFSPDGSLGGAEEAGAPQSQYFNAGAVTLSVAEQSPGVDVLAANGSPFVYLPGDLATFTVTSTGDLTVFDRIVLSENDDCSTDDFTGVVNTAGNAVTFSNIPADQVVDIPGYICFWASGDVIGAQSFTASGFLNFAAAATTDTNVPSILSNPLPLRYNGSVIDLFNVNPAANTTQESLLRYTNNSSLAYKVTLTGKDDTGTGAAGTLAFELEPGASISLTSKEVESGTPGSRNQQLGYTFTGGGFGAGTGKWKVTATAEGQALVASGLNRSATTGVISELNSEKHSDPADDAKVKSQWTTGFGPLENFLNP